MYEFWESGSPKVFSDLIVIYNKTIKAISLIGPEIGIKAYRAKFMDFGRRISVFRVKKDSYERNLFSQNKYKVLPQVKTEQGLQVVIMDPDLIWGLTQEDLQLKLYQHLHEINIPTPTPSEDCFDDCIKSLLEVAIHTNYLYPCEVKGNFESKWYIINHFKLADFRDSAEVIISSYLTEEATPEEILDGVEGIADYIEKNADEIGKKIGNKVSYLHMPGEYDKEFFDSLSRKLYPQQKEIAVAASKRLEISNNVIISGEMGVGKTSIGIATCHYHSNKPYRTIVSCPGHLVEKWAREVKDILPSVKTFTFSDWKSFYQKYRLQEPLDAPEYWIVSNEALRGGYIQRPGYNIKKRRTYDVELEETIFMETAICPRCGKPLVYEKTIEGDIEKIIMTSEDFKSHNQKNHQCFECGESLWQADRNRKGYRKVSIADLIKKQMPKGFFDFFIGDESHKYKGSTAQGLAFGGVIERAKKVIAMTGTLADGYASGLYYLLWRMEPKIFKEKNYLHNEESRAKFQSEYGFWVKSIKIRDSEYGRTSKARSSRQQVKPLPGYTINTFPEWLIERTCFLKLSDVAPHLPPKNEFVNVVEMDEDLAKNYNHIESKLKAEIKDGGSQVASIMLHTCLSYPDVSEGPEVIQIEKPEYSLNFPIPELDKDRFYNKELELQTILQTELSLGRKCLVFTTYSNTRDCIPRIEKVASSVAGAKVQALRSNTVSTKKRESWVKDKLNNEDVNILICHPELVETGLDLLECQTIIWMQTGYIPATVRQASRRSWRIGQTEPIKIIFLCYKNTLQEKCFQLIGGKLNAAGILEGSLSNEGLRNFGNDGTEVNDILSLLKDNIKTANSNEIFDRYKAEVATLLSKSSLTKPEAVRLKTLTEVLAQEEVDLTHLTNRQRKKVMQSADSQLLLFA